MLFLRGVGPCRFPGLWWRSRHDGCAAVRRNYDRAIRERHEREQYDLR